MAKYDPLNKYLLNLPENKTDITLSFAEIEKIIKGKLPSSAFEHRAWWSNEANGVHVSAHAWMEAGWKVDSLNQKERWVRFVRQQQRPPIKALSPLSGKSNLVTDEARRTTMYSANNPTKTLVIHKPGCRVIRWHELSDCGCGETGRLGNQRWFCEKHITRQAVDEFMNGRFWAILMCDICFKNE